ncbi:MAG: patatin-like phospholipase family protein [Gemmatimonadetes bacterium]|nr:patatin-like phospholipase family protein [Gemmatimonadota bacterium]
MLSTNCLKTEREKPTRFQVLSLDGGGIRGVFSAAMLAAFEEDFAPLKVIDCFDLIAGTSTGGILALGLGLGYTPREMVEFYVELGPEIFANRAGWRDKMHWVAVKYPPARLAVALKKKFGERVFGESLKRLVIPAFNIGSNDVYVFRTAHLERLRRDHRLPAWHVAMATAAAPTYFPAHQLPGKERLIDGGVWANNPAMVAIAEVVGEPHLAVPLERVHMLSLGTIRAFHDPREKLDGAGRLGWARAATDVILDATSIGVSNQAGALLGDRFVRVNTRQAAAAVTLDNVTSVDAMLAAARHESRNMAPAVAKAFFKHRAAVFTPCHPPVPATMEGSA